MAARGYRGTPRSSSGRSSSAGRTPEAIAEYLEKGFVDHGWQQDVGVDVDCPGAYVQVSHGLRYVRANWSRLFEIVDWIDGFADLQTLVVVRK